MIIEKDKKRITFTSDLFLSAIKSREKKSRLFPQIYILYSTSRVASVTKLQKATAIRSKVLCMP